MARLLMAFQRPRQHLGRVSHTQPSDTAVDHVLGSFLAVMQQRNCIVELHLRSISHTQVTQSRPALIVLGDVVCAIETQKGLLVVWYSVEAEYFVTLTSHDTC